MDTRSASQGRKTTPSATKSAPGDGKKRAPKRDTDDMVQIELKCVGPGADGRGCIVYTPVLIPRKVQNLKNFVDRDFMCGLCSNDLFRDCQEEIANLKSELSRERSRITVETKYQGDLLRQNSLRNTLRISGLAEVADENTAGIVKSMLGAIGGEVKPEDFLNIRRVGKTRGNGRARPVILEAKNDTVMKNILREKKELKGNALYEKVRVVEELTPARWKLLHYLKKIQTVKFVDSRGGNLLCYREEEDPVTVAELADIQKLGVRNINYEEIRAELNF